MPWLAASAPPPRSGCSHVLHTPPAHRLQCTTRHMQSATLPYHCLCGQTGSLYINSTRSTAMLPQVFVVCMLLIHAVPWPCSVCRPLLLHLVACTAARQHTLHAALHLAEDASCSYSPTPYLSYLHPHPCTRYERPPCGALVACPCCMTECLCSSNARLVLGWAPACASMSTPYTLILLACSCSSWDQCTHTHSGSAAAGPS